MRYITPGLTTRQHPSGYSSDDEVEESLEQERSLSPRVATGPPQVRGIYFAMCV